MTQTKPNGANRRHFLGMGAGALGTLALPGCGGSAEAQTITPSSAPLSGSSAGLCLPGMAVATDYKALRAQRLLQVEPEMRAIYETAAATPPLRQLGLAAVRAAGQVPANAVVPAGVAAYNIEIPGPAGPIPTRVWRPQGATASVGVYLSTHGGGWNFGNGMDYHDAEEGQHVLDWGCAVVRPDFRIAPEHKFPAAVEDCYAALKYLGENGASMGFDTSRIGVGGGCAGANIGTVISLMARDAGDVLPAIQFLWSPACDMRNNYLSHLEFADGYGLRLDDMNAALEAMTKAPNDELK